MNRPPVLPLASALLSLMFLPLSACCQSVQLADSLFKKGQHYDDRGNMRQAEFYYREAYTLYRQHPDTATLLKAGKEYANALVYRSKHAEAMKLFRMLLEMNHPANDAYNRGDIYNSMGWASKRAGKLDQSLDYYQKALPLAESSGDRLLIGVIYSNLGEFWRKKGNYSKALEYSQQSLPFFKSLDNQKSIAITLNSMGMIYKKLALFDKSLAYYSKSLEIRKKLENIAMLATIYDNIASVQFNLGNYDQALVAYEKSLEFWRKAGVPQRTEETLNDIGIFYKSMGYYEKALTYFKKSLAIASKISGPSSIATTTNNLASLFWAQGNQEKASAFFKKALDLRRKVGNPYRIASSLSGMVRIALANNNYSQAKKYAGEIKAIADSTNSYELHRSAAMWSGNIRFHRQRFKVALQYYERALAYADFLTPVDRLEPLKRLAQTCHRLNSDSAVVYGQQAVSIIEELRSNVGAVSYFKSGFFKQHSGFYTDLASWILQYRQDKEEAFRLAELAKARSLGDELVLASLNLERQLPEKERVEQSQLRNRIDELYTQLEQVSSQENQAEIRKQINAAELDYAAYKNRLHRQYPEYKQLKPPAPISLHQAQSQCDEHTALLEYAVSDDGIMIFLISQKKVWVKQIDRPENQSDSVDYLSVRVTDFKNAILSNAPVNELRKTSAKLYDLLIGPFEGEINLFSNLIIIPDGPLAYLPFETLSNNGRYLLEDYNIKYTPSLTSLSLLEKTQDLDRKDLLAVAGSEFSPATTGELQQKTLPALPSTLIEIDSIAAHFRQVTALKGDQLSEEKLKEVLNRNRYKYIHLATHGIIDGEYPDRSGLALAGGSDGMTASAVEDGMLRSSEIYGLNLDSDMVVLSACNTGLGKMVRGEGMLGMQRSFFLAGASTVVVSLWNVYDRSTAYLMNEFYKALLNEELRGESWTDSFLRWIGWDESIPFGRKARGMRAAKLKMINHPLFHHPIYWAPFIVVGR